MTFYHGSKVDNIDKLKSIVGEFDNNGGVFISPSLSFAKSWGKYIYQVELLTDKIFDYDNEIHKRMYSDKIYEYVQLLNITKDDIYEYIYSKSRLSYIFSKIEPKFKDYCDEFVERNLKGSVRANDEFGEPIDFWETPEQYATEMLYKYPTKNINLIISINKRILYRDYYSIETNDSWIGKLGFDGAYIYEGGERNIQVYNSDNINIIGKINERIIRFGNFIYKNI